MKIVTGIGSRAIPNPYYTWLKDIAEFLAQNNCGLRSGGAVGSDTIFQKAFEKYNSPMKIYIAWNGFEGLYANGKSIILADHIRCKEYTEKYHPNPKHLSSGAYKLMNRNAHQILGFSLKTPSNLVVCYTEGGIIKGGTSQAIRIAQDYNIPIVNIGSKSSYEEVLNEVKSLLGVKES